MTGEDEIMKRVMLLVTAVLVLLSGTAPAGEKAPGTIVALVPKLAKAGTERALVEAVKSQNAKGMTLDKIKEMDRSWTATPGVNAFMQSLMSNACAQKIKSIKASAPYYAEIFVMDNKGANVCMTDKTSDYWQGDEPKWTKSYNNGAGGTDISGVKFDDSTQAYVVQVSFPVKDDGKVIGAVTVGVNVEKVK
jgi:hypothetical protein